MSVKPFSIEPWIAPIGLDDAPIEMLFLRGIGQFHKPCGCGQFSPGNVTNFALTASKVVEPGFPEYISLRRLGRAPGLVKHHRGYLEGTCTDI